MKDTAKTEIEKILSHGQPARFVYAPNYWQWFKHQKDHNLLPDEIKHCDSLLELYSYLGVDVFSRNIYSDPEKYWFGGMSDEIIDDFELIEKITYSGKDKVIEKEYHSSLGILNEKLIYIFKESTLVQNQFLISDYVREFAVFKHMVKNRRWNFDKEKFKRISHAIGENGVLIAGEFFSPLKMLHLTMGPVNAVYFLMEYPEKAMELIDIHEKAQLSFMKQSLENGMKVLMAMDNLDTMFHPPDYVQQYSSSFYEKASKLCHEHNASFFIHACGHQRVNLDLISSYNVDGLEGVAFPPLGDVNLEEVLRATHNNFIITGGISAMETRDLKTKEEIFTYVKTLFEKLLPYKNRFIFSSSCNTAIDTSWETIKHFRDAWLKYREI